jgi:Transmembrane domain of unknown function (DUF3566)
MMDDAMKPDDDVDPFEAELDELDDGSMVHHVDAVELRSLGVVAGLFYLTAFLVLALAIAGVYLFAASLGLISQVEDFMRSVGFRGFKFVGPEVILGFVLILAALVVFLTVMTLVAGAFYNLLGTGKHGVRFRTTVVEARGRRTRRVYDDEAEAASDDEVVAATAPLAEQPAAAAAVAAAPRAAAVDEETSIDDWVKAPGDDVIATAEDGDDEAKAPVEPKAPARKKAKVEPTKVEEADAEETEPKSAEKVVATPLVFGPVPEDADGADTNGDGAAQASDDDSGDDEPQKPEAVAG